MDLLIRCDVTATHIFDWLALYLSGHEGYNVLDVFISSDRFRPQRSVAFHRSIELNFSELNTMIVQYISRYKNSASNIERISGYHKCKQ
jgi:hypothetical protein